MRDAHAGRFLLRRALRLLPGLFVAMWILAPVLAWLRPEAFAWTRDLLHPWSALVVVTIIGATALARLSWHLVERRALTLKTTRHAARGRADGQRAGLTRPRSAAAARIAPCCSRFHGISSHSGAAEKARPSGTMLPARRPADHCMRSALR